MLEYLVVQLVMLHVADGLGHDDVVVFTGARQLLDSVWPSHSLQTVAAVQGRLLQTRTTTHTQTITTCISQIFIRFVLFIITSRTC